MCFLWCTESLYVAGEVIRAAAAAWVPWVPWVSVQLGFLGLVSADHPPSLRASKSPISRGMVEEGPIKRALWASRTKYLLEQFCRKFIDRYNSRFGRAEYAKWKLIF